MATVEGPLTRSERMALTFRPTVVGCAKPLACYAASPSGAYVYPAFFHAVGTGSSRVTGELGEGVGLAFAGTLRDDQRAVAEVLLRGVLDTRAAMCTMPTGKGKTVVALWVAAQLHVPTLVVVHRKSLKAQWEERIRLFCGTAAAIEVALVQSHKGAREYGLVIYDEAHHMSARTFCATMMRVRTRYALGLSATPVRADGMHVALRLFFGAPTDAGPPTDLRAQIHVCAVPDFGVTEHRAYNRAMGRVIVNAARLLSDIAASADRTTFVIARVTQLVASGRTVLLMSHRRAHCVLMASALRASGISVALCMGGATTVVEPRHQVIVGTTSAVSEGFDEPRLDTLVFATPLRSVTQAVGRILRQRNAMHPLVVDFVDPIGSCIRQRDARKADYRKLGHTINGIAIDNGGLCAPTTQ